MDRHHFTEIALPDGRAIHRIRVCEDVFDFDLLVSIPVMKMHMHTGVTLAVKNMKGCLWRRSKVELHMLPPIEGDTAKPIDVAIADMSSLLRPHLAIVDGTVGMEGLGPGAGRAKPLGVVLAGTDAYAADAVACRLMGVDARQVPHLRFGADRGYGVIALSQIDVAPEDWLRWAAPFAAPPENLTIEFPSVTVLGRNSCSAASRPCCCFSRTTGRSSSTTSPPTVRSISPARAMRICRKGPSAWATARSTSGHVFVPGCPRSAARFCG